MTPLLPGLKGNNPRLQCSNCGASFPVQVARGVFVSALKGKRGDVFLAICDGCASGLCESSLHLLVSTDCPDIHALQQKVREAAALRRGYVTHFEH